jgi:hypothetical protein
MTKENSQGVWREYKEGCRFGFAIPRPAQKKKSLPSHTFLFVKPIAYKRADQHKLLWQDH